LYPNFRSRVIRRWPGRSAAARDGTAQRWRRVWRSSRGRHRPESFYPWKTLQTSTAVCCWTRYFTCSKLAVPVPPPVLSPHSIYIIHAQLDSSVVIAALLIRWDSLRTSLISFQTDWTSAPTVRSLGLYSVRAYLDPFYCTIDALRDKRGLFCCTYVCSLSVTLVMCVKNSLGIELFFGCCGHNNALQALRRFGSSQNKGTGWSFNSQCVCIVRTMLLQDVCPSKRLNISSNFFHHSSFSEPNLIAIFRPEPP